jgi:hypothetical protein
MIKAIIAVILICASGVAQTDKAQIYTEWNACVHSLADEGDFETGLWPKLHGSLKSDPPEHVRSLDRERILEELIKLHKERISHLESMLELERRH